MNRVRQAEQAGLEHQEHDQTVPEQKAGGTWLARRTVAVDSEQLGKSRASSASALFLMGDRCGTGLSGDRCRSPDSPPSQLQPERFLRRSTEQGGGGDPEDHGEGDHGQGYSDE
ncbi:hypothetical protein [Streptomyces sp. NPDC055992]|uniref:hypothetical protein n=1 Tax=Streptomyces sp. NPDC055992 TaxID=3345673 RepID=UPI0035E30B13